MKYTGKQYVAIDNSYLRNLSNDRKQGNDYLAGSMYNLPVLTTIVSEPFMVNVTKHKRIEPELFIMVINESGETYFVLFHEHGVITQRNTFEMFLKRHEEYKNEMDW